MKQSPIEAFFGYSSRVTVLLVAAVCLLAPSLSCSASADDVDEAMVSFYQNNYLKARRLARKHRKDPKALMVLAFCDLQHTATRDYKSGLKRLQQVADMTDDQPELRRAVLITLAASVDALRSIGQLPRGIECDVEGICKTFMAMDPPVLESFEAATLMGRHAWGESDPGKQNDLVAVLADFANKYLNDPRSAPICKYLGEFRLVQGKIAETVQWLERALVHGFENPAMNPEVLYTVARLKHRELKDYEGAAKAYRRFIKQHSYNKMCAQARSYLKEIGEEAGGSE